MVFNKIELDITKEADIETIIKRIRPQFCINTAAYTNVSKAEKEKKNMTNQCYCCRPFSQGLFSTQHPPNSPLYRLCFRWRTRTPFSEEDPTNPINEYGDKSPGRARSLEAKRQTLCG